MEKTRQQQIIESAPPEIKETLLRMLKEGKLSDESQAQFAQSMDEVVPEGSSLQREMRLREASRIYGRPVDVVRSMWDDFGF